MLKRRDPYRERERSERDAEKAWALFAQMGLGKLGTATLRDLRINPRAPAVARVRCFFFQQDTTQGFVPSNAAAPPQISPTFQCSLHAS